MHRRDQLTPAETTEAELATRNSVPSERRPVTPLHMVLLDAVGSDSRVDPSRPLSCDSDPVTRTRCGAGLSHRVLGLVWSGGELILVVHLSRGINFTSASG